MRFPLAALLMSLPLSAHAQAVQPGQWRIQMTVTSFDMPGAPPMVAEAFKQPIDVRRCVTPDDAAKGPLEMIKDREHCRSVRQSVIAGKVDAVLVCEPSIGTTTVIVTGNFSSTKFAMNATIEAGGQVAMKMTTVAIGELIGACKDLGL
jgi:hypothetical protein